MPLGRAVRSMIGFGLCVLAATLWPGCSCMHINGTCSTTDDCLTQANHSGKGVQCVEGFCHCPGKGRERGKACCPDGRQNCPQADYECRTEEVCEALLLAAVGCFPPSPECTLDSDCPGPPDHRCGQGKCTEGRCSLDIRAHQPMEGQYPGDCKRLVCSPEGLIQAIEDPSDLPNDSRGCTYDLCEGDTPLTPPFPELHPCMGDAAGICLFGQCVECLEEGVSMCGMGLMCLAGRCLLPACNDLLKNNQETSTDCGGPDCLPCKPGLFCTQASDCISGVCTAGVCQVPTHTDGVKNGDETGIDCGYPGGPLHTCEDGDGCSEGTDCKSSVCYLGYCNPPTCTDSVRNGTETGPDCGGPCPPCQN